jgi:hypothetical protein
MTGKIVAQLARKPCRRQLHETPCGLFFLSTAWLGKKE